MTTQEVANRLVALCRIGQVDQAQEELFAENAQSIEFAENFGPKVTNGLAAIKVKSAHFQTLIEEFHSASISDPIVTGSCFAITWVFEATMKGQGRMTLPEVCVYKVENGKIILEQFFS